MSEPRADDYCVFCHFIERRHPAQILYEDATTFAFLDNTAVTEGHTLVIPKRHAPDIWTVSEDESTAVMRTAHRMARLLRDTLPMDGLTMFQANGPAGWQDVFHLHLHLVPRHHGDHLNRPWKAELAAPATLVRTREKILSKGAQPGDELRGETLTSPDS
jgi:histidine triad (HIT) family protein